VSTVLVYPPASGIGRTTTVTRTLRPLTPAAAERVVADLAAGGIHLAAAMERDGLTRVDVVNLAVLTLDHVTKAAADAGKPLREALDDE
jgi:hypothetical protein